VRAPTVRELCVSGTPPGTGRSSHPASPVQPFASGAARRWLHGRPRRSLVAGSGRRCLSRTTVKLSVALKGRRPRAEGAPGSGWLHSGCTARRAASSWSGRAPGHDGKSRVGSQSLQPTSVGHASYRLRHTPARTGSPSSRSRRAVPGWEHRLMRVWG